MLLTHLGLSRCRWDVYGSKKDIQEDRKDGEVEGDSKGAGDSSVSTNDSRGSGPNKACCSGVQ